MSANGTASLDFGASPGKTDASLDVATAGVTGTSRVEAWVFPADTADHSADEHRVEHLKVSAVWKVDGTITITGIADDPPINGMAPGTLYGVYNVGWVWI
jgi:hypothetical protein